MNKKITKKNIKKQKKSKLKELFSRLTVGGASVATVVVVTATSFFVDEFYIETFSDTIYYETYIEPTEISYPEDVDPNDPEVEIVLDDVELRLRVSSQFGELFYPMVLYENKGKITDLTPNTNYELTVQHYNGFQWVALKSQNARTDIENKASIVDVIEIGALTEDKRNLEVLIYTEFEPEKVKNVHLSVQENDALAFPLSQGENKIVIEDIKYIETIDFEIIYDILEDDVWIETIMDQKTYDMLPYFDFSYEATISSLDIHMTTNIFSKKTYEYFVYIDRTASSERIDDIDNLEFINYIDLELLRVYAKDIEDDVVYHVTSIDLSRYRRFPFILTELDHHYTLTLVDELERIDKVYYYDDQNIQQEWNYSETQDNVYIYELSNISIIKIEIKLINDPHVTYIIEIEGV
jgi:hypothetical protein